jgi:hypothetical protein
MSFQILSGTLASDVNNSNALTLTLPNGLTWGVFKSGANQQIAINQSIYTAPKDFAVSSSANTSVTLTPVSGVTWTAGSSYSFQLEQIGGDTMPDIYAQKAQLNGTVVRPRIELISLGSPAAAAAAGVATGATPGAAAAFSLVSTTVTLDVPRNITVTATSSVTTNITVTGTDVYGAKLVEVIALSAATSGTGAKAFKTVTSVTTSASLSGNSTSIGYGAVLGLPFFLNGGTSGGSGFIVREIVDGAVAGTAGTFKGGDTTLATGSTGDVRGTYAPNSAPNGSRAYQLLVALPDIDFPGASQFAG